MAGQAKAQPTEKVAAPKPGAGVILRAHTVFGYKGIDGELHRAYIGDVIRVDEETANRLTSAHMAGGAVGAGKPTGSGKPVIVNNDLPPGESDEDDDDEIAMDGDETFAPTSDLVIK